MTQQKAKWRMNNILYASAAVRQNQAHSPTVAPNLKPPLASALPHEKHITHITP